MSDDDLDTSRIIFKSNHQNHLNDVDNEEAALHEWHFLSGNRSREVSSTRRKLQIHDSSFPQSTVRSLPKNISKAWNNCETLKKSKSLKKLKNLKRFLEP